MAKVRLDALLAQRGLFASRSRAAASVLAGDVHLGSERHRASKPGQLVADDVAVSVAEPPRFVSRGGLKLERALEVTGIDVTARRCLDAGASTGGFTDCLLQCGAAHVTAADVAYGELHWRLRNDQRVTVLERCNVRGLEPQALAYEPDLIVVDVSFISATKVLPALVSCAAPRHDLLVLCKPQFEVGRARVGRGGVVRDRAHRREALVALARSGRRLGERVAAFVPSGLPGPKGNLETFVWMGRGDGDAPEIADLEAAAERVEA